ncbi:hypothetical protein AVEN_254059-1 [Araneus ventricosus]|uniref:Uncharacterized protein n=1 Tax=Araneus ventricosus TaxID=182803 RepID=A0A4Y2BXN1_ARAVE|nr:hypothetical protein AVEN_254059-1 [Araneus ventricosus]
MASDEALTSIIGHDAIPLEGGMSRHRSGAQPHTIIVAQETRLLIHILMVAPGLRVQYCRQTEITSSDNSSNLILDLVQFRTYGRKPA